MFYPVLGHKSIRIENHGDEHVSWELVNIEEVQEDDEELIQGVLYFSKGVRGEVLTVILLYPRHAQLQENLACEWGVRAEPEGVHCC